MSNHAGGRPRLRQRAGGGCGAAAASATSSACTFALGACWRQNWRLSAPRRGTVSTTRCLSAVERPHASIGSRRKRLQQESRRAYAGLCQGRVTISHTASRRGLRDLYRRGIGYAGCSWLRTRDRARSRRSSRQGKITKNPTYEAPDDCRVTTPDSCASVTPLPDSLSLGGGGGGTVRGTPWSGSASAATHWGLSASSTCSSVVQTSSDGRAARSSDKGSEVKPAQSTQTKRFR